jgi:hypothetical protein
MDANSMQKSDRLDHRGFVRPFLAAICNPRELATALQNGFLKARPELAAFLLSIEKRTGSYVGQVKAEFSVRGFTSFEVLGDESYVGGTVPVRARGAGAGDVVIYTNRRLFNPVFYRASEWLSNRIGLNIAQRPLNPDENTAFHVRPYIFSEKTTDKRAASISAGALLALCQYLMLTDAHRANVVFNSDVPVIIDDECPFQVSSARLPCSGELGDYFHGFDRTRLLPSASQPSVGATGLAELLRGGLDIGALLRGYRKAIVVFRTEQQVFEDFIVRALDERPWVRYLIRGRNLYDRCKADLGLSLHRGELEGLRLSRLRDRLRRDKDNSEFEGCIDYEIAAIRRGDTPYFVLNLKDGSLAENAEARAILKIPNPLAAWKEHLRHIGGTDPDNASDRLRHSLDRALSRSKYRA